MWITGRCDHVDEEGQDHSPGPPTDSTGTVLQYFSKTGPAIDALKTIVLDKKWNESLKYYIHFMLKNKGLIMITLQ